MVHQAVLVFLGVLASLNGLYCLSQEPKLVCWYSDPKEEIPLNQLCTHIIYDSFTFYEGRDMDLKKTLPSEYLSLQKVKKNYPQVKLIPYYSVINLCPFENFFTSDLAELDGIAFTAGRVEICEMGNASHPSSVLKKMGARRENFTVFAHVSYHMPSWETLNELSSFVDLIIIDIDLRKILDEVAGGMDLSNILYPLSLHGHMRVETDYDEGRERKIEYREICGVIKSKRFKTGWTNETDSPILEGFRNPVRYENEMSIALKARSALTQGYGGVAVDLTDDDSFGICGEAYPLISAVNKELFPPDAMYNINDQEELKETVSYCMWKSSLSDISSLDMNKISGCSFIGYEQTGETGKSTMKNIARLQLRNPSVKAVLAVKVAYILWASFDSKHFLSYLRTNRISGLDIVLDSKHLSEDEAQKVLATLEEMKQSELGRKLFYILSFRKGHTSLNHPSALLRLAQAVDYINFAGFISSDKELPNNMVSAAPLNSRFDNKNLVFSINHAILEGIPASKILVGLPNFGYSYSTDNATSFQEISFQGVCEVMKNVAFTKGWDPYSSTPFLKFKDKYVTYENSTSINIKLDFVRSLGLGGVSVYWIDSDECKEVSSDGQTLSNQIKEYIFDVNNRTCTCCK